MANVKESRHAMKQVHLSNLRQIAKDTYSPCLTCPHSRKCCSLPGSINCEKHRRSEPPSVLPAKPPAHNP